MRSRKPVSKYDCDEMDGYTDGYVEFVLEQLTQAKLECADPLVLIEQRLDFSCWVPEGFGTGDCLIVADKLLHIIDFKYGQGVLVDAEENPQMMLYALGALRLFDSLYDITEVNTPVGKLPSFKAMTSFALKDERVKAVFAEERAAQAAAEFNDENWQARLELDKAGNIKNTLRNLTTILENDPNLKPLVFNQLLDGMEIKGDVPWKHPSKFWRDADDAQLISYVDTHYGTFSARNYDIAVTKVSDDRSYHPIRAFIEQLPEWDGIERVDTLLIDYLAAEDTP